MPVTQCENGFWRVGSGECRYPTREKAIEVWQAILASGQYGKMKISYDYDGVLSKSENVDKALEQVKKVAEVYVISARHSKEQMVHLAPKLGIPTGHIFAVGSNTAKVDKIKELGISVHYDDNPDVIEQVKEFTKGILVNG